ncbi:7536_t:CDS:1, partial [Racocetra persica]
YRAWHIFRPDYRDTNLRGGGAKSKNRIERINKRTSVNPDIAATIFRGPSSSFEFC